MNYIASNRENLSVNNYVLKAASESNYWFGISEKKLNEYRSTHSQDFKIIIFGSDREGDFYSIPFPVINPLLAKKTLIKSQNNRSRWVGDIKYHQLRIRNCPTRIDLSKFYGISLSPLKINIVEEEENDYSINNRRIEINARLKQSKFRLKILKNYKAQCCITGIDNKELLIASHIIPWAERINTRLDPSNGLCLFSIFDKLFDKGYITISKNFEVIPSRIIKANKKVYAFISSFIGKKISLPIANPPKQEYLNYHRKNIFKG